MPLSVIPPPARHGRLALAAATGLLAGAAGVLLNRLPHYTNGNAAALGANMATLGPLLVAALCLGLFSLRARTAFLCSAAFGFGSGIGNQLTGALLDTTGAQWAFDAGGWTPLALLFGDTISGVVIGAISTGFWWLARRVWTLLPEDGVTCRRCGYSIGPAPIALCPECGSPLTANHNTATIWRCTEWLKRRGRIMLVLVLIGAIAALGVYLAQPRIRRARAFYRRFNTPIGGIMSPLQPTPGAEQLCPGAWLPFPDDNTRGIGIAYLPFDDPACAAMELRLETHSHVGPAEEFYAPIQPGLVSRLTRDQSEYTIAHGIPPALLDAFRTTPTPTSGWTDKVIDPAPFFPADAAPPGR